jgi:hypothetical protein
MVGQLACRFLDTGVKDTCVRLKCEVQTNNVQPGRTAYRITGLVTRTST